MIKVSAVFNFIKGIEKSRYAPAVRVLNNSKPENNPHARIFARICALTPEEIQNITAADVRKIIDELDASKLRPPSTAVMYAAYGRGTELAGDLWGSFLNDMNKLGISAKHSQQSSSNRGRSPLSRSRNRSRSQSSNHSRREMTQHSTSSNQNKTQSPGSSHQPEPQRGKSKGAKKAHRL